MALALFMLAEAVAVLIQERLVLAGMAAVVRVVLVMAQGQQELLILAVAAVVVLIHLE